MRSQNDTLQEIQTNLKNDPLQAKFQRYFDYYQAIVIFSLRSESAYLKEVLASLQSYHASFMQLVNSANSLHKWQEGFGQFLTVLTKEILEKKCPYQKYQLPIAQISQVLFITSLKFTAKGGQVCIGGSPSEVDTAEEDNDLFYSAKLNLHAVSFILNKTLEQLEDRNVVVERQQRLEKLIHKAEKKQFLLANLTSSDSKDLCLQEDMNRLRKQIEKLKPEILVDELSEINDRVSIEHFTFMQLLYSKMIAEPAFSRKEPVVEKSEKETQKTAEKKSGLSNLRKNCVWIKKENNKKQMHRKEEINKIEKSSRF